MLLPDPADNLAPARRLRLIGLAGSSAMALAATAVGALPTRGGVWYWPSTLWPQARPWPAVLLAYLGLTLLVGAWWRLRSVLIEIPDRLGFVLTTLAVWAIPLALAPPLYSRDVYSYVAQGTMYSTGLDPYRYGPAVLGGAMADNVSAMWQYAPAPYGPVFLAVASMVTSVAGSHVVIAILGLRLVMISALAATTACVIPLARRFGVDPARAVWLGMLNPLMLAHVVSGAHNDILILMLMAAGVLLAVKDRPILAAVVLGFAVLVKVPAAAAIVVIVPSMARQLRGRFRLLRGGLVVGSAALGTILVVTWMMGAWYGWVAALGDTAKIRNGLSVSTDVGVVIDAIGAARGDGGQVLDAVAVSRVVGVVAALVLIWVMLTRTRGRPLYALGLIMSAVVLLGPVVHPWYVLWGIVPLAASTRDNRVRTAVAALSVGLALYPMPWGEGFTGALPWGILGIAGATLMLRADVTWTPTLAAATAPRTAQLESSGARVSS